MADTADPKLPHDSSSNPALLALRQRIDALDRELLALLGLDALAAQLSDAAAIPSLFLPMQSGRYPLGSRMTIRLCPPGRKSTSARAIDQGLGTNHCLSKSGSVQQRNKV